MKGGLLAVGVILGLGALVVLGLVIHAIDTSFQLYNQATDPQRMEQEYQAAHQQCAGVRQLWQQWQTDTKAAKDYDTQNAAILNGSAKDTPIGQVHTQSAQLHTVAQGDMDALHDAASQYDNLIEDHTKSFGITWVKTAFFDHGLPQQISPPDYTVDCGSGVWANNA